MKTFYSIFPPTQLSNLKHRIWVHRAGPPDWSPLSNVDRIVPTTRICLGISTPRSKMYGNSAIPQGHK